MPRTVVFETPGLIDVRAFTTFGVNSKPNTTNPIGFFGTGLKYAVAVLCRLGARPRVFIGRDEYLFYTRPETFRDREFTMIRMRKRRWGPTSWLRASHHALPITTELGKTWKPWQAYRELESNTRDENGQTHLLDGGPEQQVEDLVASDRTLIAVEHEDFVQAHLDQSQIFLPGGATERSGSDRTQVLDRPSRHLYYRGLRVSDLSKSTLYTYNFLAPVELTEDRTLKYDFMARYELARHVAASDDAQMIEAVLTAPEDRWEHGLDMSGVIDEPSAAFQEVVRRRSHAVNRSTIRYAGGWHSFSGTGRVPWNTFGSHGRPWRAEGAFVYDAEGTCVMSAGHGVSGPRAEQILRDVVDIVNGAADTETERAETDVGKADPPSEAYRLPDDNQIPF